MTHEVFAYLASDPKFCWSDAISKELTLPNYWQTAQKYTLMREALLQRRILQNSSFSGIFKPTETIQQFVAQLARRLNCL